jgi:hypothetical protein
MANRIEAAKDGEERVLGDWRTPTVTELGEAADAENIAANFHDHDGGTFPNCS